MASSAARPSLQEEGNTLVPAPVAMVAAVLNDSTSATTRQALAAASCRAPAGPQSNRTLPES
jgi:hypothetical protein